jgi:hypothetical protein
MRDIWARFWGHFSITYPLGLMPLWPRAVAPDTAAWEQLPVIAIERMGAFRMIISHCGDRNAARRRARA